LSRDILEKIHSSIGINARKGKKSNIYRLPVAAAAVILLFLSIGVYRAYIKNRTSFEEVYTRPGETRKLILADGTEVWLSPESHLTYPQEFNGPVRNVRLSGEAFFNVSSDPGHPFIVNSGSLQTNVLGTSFYVNAYENRKYVTVTVATGAVSVKAIHHPGTAGSAAVIKLMSNQRAVFTVDSALLRKEDFPDAAMMLYERRNGYLRYNGTDLDAVIEDLSVQYGVKIKLAAALRNCTYYGDFNIHRDDLKVSLKLLCLTLNAKLRKDGEAYVIDGKGC
jgi:ferric-dicitrate binding protein FerR (iron transport regulator)